jgi:hypothetical protein
MVKRYIVSSAGYYSSPSSDYSASGAGGASISSISIIRDSYRPTCEQSSSPYSIPYFTAASSASTYYFKSQLLLMEAS